MTMILRVAKSKTSEDDDDDKPMSKDEKKGEWNLYLDKDKTKWRWTLVNPKGGSGASSANSKGGAIGAAIGRGVSDTMGKDKVWVIERIWDAGKGDYVTKKTYWDDIKEGKSSGGASRDHDR